ncbi:sugar transferase [Phenylobacterium sp.]|uniref:sugar transferase n=1 Tax=Phenylobacterium sp. TaxID=1871053 RepID=UPI0025E644C9|nr:sugar transferase [Phenylobacterium sp.]MBX3486150.1 sugar transferase [Phenylobacterium sp.]MCW5760948.1 sugar transferase [Phenylobacterium sp.]
MTGVVARTVRPNGPRDEPVATAVAPPETSGVATSFGKRLLDILGAAFALLVFLPLLITVGVMIRIESGGPAIFKQRRTGYQGRIFTIYKFRTMTVAEDCADVRQATRGDARVTALGAVLRKLSIDELPQFMNVLKGDMSLVGPRPHALAHDDQYGGQIPTYADRFRARPGLTGLAQVNGLRGEIRNLRGMRDRVAADNLYIDGWSLGLDVAILARTALVIFRDPQAY